MARLFIIVAALVATLTFGAQAQVFPSRPVTLVVPWPAGGATDIAVRSLATASEKQLGQPIKIENRPGAGGALAPAQMAASAAPDGHTISQIAITVFRYPLLQKTTFDPANDLTYIIALTGYTFGVVVRKDAPWKTFQEFLDDAKANPGKINYGTPGAGTSLHITMEQIAGERGIQWTHVPFKGNAEGTSALLGGHVHALADATGWAALVNSGEFRLLVTWGAARTKNWPNVPTLKEAGINMVSNSPFGLAGPKGMDPAAVKILHDAFRKGMQDPSYRATMAKFDQEEFYLDSAGYRAWALKEIAAQKVLLERLGLAKK